MTAGARGVCLRVVVGLSAAACSAGSTRGASDEGSSPMPGSPDGGPPELVALEVTVTVDGPPSGLTPAFGPGIHDYYVRCSAGLNHLDVSMTASAGALAALTRPSPSAPRQDARVSVDVEEGDALVAVATTKTGAASSPYWVRCLPHDLPLLAMTTYVDAGVPATGYYLLGNARPDPDRHESGYAMVLDVHGVPVWYSAPAPRTYAVPGPVESLSPGHISFIAMPLLNAHHTSAFTSEDLAASPPASTSLPPRSPESYATDEHELRLYQGRYYALSYPLVRGVDLTGLVLGSLRPGKDAMIQDCRVLVIDPSQGDGVVATWAASEHFDPVKVSTHPTTEYATDLIAGELPDGGIAYDPFHCTSIDVDPANGNLLISARHMDSVFYVDMSSPRGTVLWKMGGEPSSLDAETVFITPEDPFNEQHDARLLGWSAGCRGGTGQVSMFDGETTGERVARGVIYDVVVGGPGETCAGAGRDGGATSPGSARVAWQYPGTAPSTGAGSLRVSADGTRVIGWGIAPRAFTEVDAEGHALRELTLGADYSYRAVKVPLSTFDLDVLREAAGK